MEIDQAKKFFEKTTKPHYLTSEIINLQNQFKDNLEWIERCSNGLEETFGDKTYLKVQWGIDSRYWDMESNDYLKVQLNTHINIFKCYPFTSLSLIFLTKARAHGNF